MCGFVGFYHPFETRDIQLALDAISHRGPDDEGTFQENGLTLGHTRLAILDLSPRGHQPMFSDDGKFVIVYNGEIYNHLEIRKDLEGKFVFRSSSDTETLLYGLIEWGPSILKELNGIFAFALFNRETHELFLARDHLGVKPLYYYWDGKVFAFGSEMKSFTRIDGLQKDIDPTALVNYLHFLWSPGTKTPWKLVKKLLPGHYIELDLKELPLSINPIQYYDIPFDGTYDSSGEQRLTDHLEELLLESVERQLLSDVPVGFFLSGGLDSSLLVAMVRKLRPKGPLQTFTIDTASADSDEGFDNDLKYAREVAAHLDAQLEIVDSWIDIAGDFDKMIWHLDEPQADPAPLNVLKICRRAREMGFKVLISGAGGDDLFSGYRRHQALRYEPLLKRIPPFLSDAFARALSPFDASRTPVRQLRKLLSGAGQSSLDRITGYFAWIDTERNKSLFDDKWKEDIESFDPSFYLRNLLKNIPGECHELNRLLYMEMRSFLVDHNLNYTDKMAMAASVEVRVPYLDKELVTFSTKIPPNLKMRGRTTKYLLKKVAERYLPKTVIDRPKIGFGAPVRKWIREDLSAMIGDYLGEARIRERGIFNPNEVEKLIHDNQEGRVDAGYTIWCLLAIESWLRQFTNTIDS